MSLHAGIHPHTSCQNRSAPDINFKFNISNLGVMRIQRTNQREDKGKGKKVHKELKVKSRKFKVSFKFR